MQPTDRPTPRTDEQAFANTVPADFARELERECASLTEVGGELEKQLEALIPAAEQDLRGAKALEHIAPKAVANKAAKLESARAALQKWKKLRGEAR